MSPITIISISITIAGFVGGIIGSVAKLSAEYGKLKKTVEANEKRGEEERAHVRVKFSNLFATTNAHESTLAALKNNVTNLQTTCARIEAKLDRLIEKEVK